MKLITHTLFLLVIFMTTGVVSAQEVEVDKSKQNIIDLDKKQIDLEKRINDVSSEVDSIKKSRSTDLSKGVESIKAKIDEDKKESAEDALAERANKLATSGLYLGAALMLDIDFGSGVPNLDKEGANVTGYFAFFPAFLGSRDATNVYCAQRFFGSEQQFAQESADAYARKKARTIFDEVWSVRGSDSVDNYILAYFGQVKDVSIDADGLNPESKPNNKKTLKQAYIDSIKSDLSRYAQIEDKSSSDAINLRSKIIDETAYLLQDWNVGQPVKCISNSIGVFVGKSIDNFNLTVGEDSSGNLTKVEYDNVFKAGIVIAPSSNLSLLVGYSLYKTESELDNTDAIHSVSIGLGLQTDTLSIFSR